MWGKAKRTHCKRGHPLKGDNLYVSPRGSRSCKACRKIGKAAYRLKQGHAPIDPTRCRKGHSFDAENTVIVKSGHRKCRTCMTDTAKAYNAKRNYDGDNAKRRKPGGIADRHHTAGAAAERAAIVAWLRNFWDGADDEDFKCAADAIAAGAHHGKETT